MQINSTRLLDNLSELAEIGARTDGGVCRLALTDEDKISRDWLLKKMQDLNLETHIDEIGNMYGIRKGKSLQPLIAFGSHLDTVTTGGKYDGSYGVLAGLEVINTLNENEIVTDGSIALINFTNEEGARFAPDMMGSLAVSKPELLKEIWESKSFDNESLNVKSELQRIGYLGDAKVNQFSFTNYLELHIEQGPILENEKLQIGAVELVQGIYWTEYVFHGAAAHAGTTPISARKDAGLVVSSLNLFLRKLSGVIKGQLCTMGLIEYYPNVVNVVPERVKVIIDLRNPDKELLKQAQEKADQYIKEISESHQVSFDRVEKVRFDPVPFSQEMVEAIEKSASGLNLKFKRMVSGAGHDAQMMAAICKAAMIFIPSINGISHNVKEYSNPEDLINGANVLLNTVATLVSNV
jgi:N-carbamoyl-L-amino-acid hydrolase